MANTNTGIWQRFENDGALLIGTSPILNYVPGSLKISRRQRERIGNKDRGVLGGMTVGDQRPQMIEFQIYRTARTTGSEATIAMMLPAATTGAETFFTLVVKVAEYLGATTGESATFNKCVLADGIDEAAGAGTETDKITVKIMHHGDIVTPASY
jgi:hypothetical protein